MPSKLLLETALRTFERSTATARMEAMTSSLLPGESLFGSGNTSASKGMERVVSRAKSASNIGSSGELTGLSVWMPGHRHAVGMRGCRHPQPPELCSRSAVWFLTVRPGATPGSVSGYIPRAFPDRRKSDFIRLLDLTDIRVYINVLCGPMGLFLFLKNGTSHGQE